MRLWSSFVAIFFKEFRHVARDRATLALALMFPIFQLLLFGFIDQNVRDLPTVIVDQDRSEASRELMDRLRATRTFDITRVTDSTREARDEIIAGRARVAVVVPPDFQADRLRGAGAQVLVLIDGSDSNASSQALASVNGLVAQMSLEQIGGFAKLPVSAQPVILFNPEGRTANFIIPGLVAILMQLVGLLFTSMAIVREREKGTMEQLLVTPIQPLGLMLGKLAPYLVISLFEMAVVLLIMRFGFAVPIRGSLGFLFAVAVVYLFAILAMGLFISTRAQTVPAAQQMSMMLVLPSVFLSGYIFPQAGLPEPLYYLGLLLPATHMMSIMRGVVLRDAGLMDLVPEVLALLALSVVLVAASASRLRKISG
jgi:ABC-2 type transport system permease protein